MTGIERILNRLDDIAEDVADVRVACARLEGRVDAIAKLEARVERLEAERPRRRSTDEVPAAREGSRRRALVIGGSAAGGGVVLGFLGWLVELVRGWAAAKQ